MGVGTSALMVLVPVPTENDPIGAIAALICTFAFEKTGERVRALGLHFKPNLWWLLAWLIPIVLAGASVAFTLALYVTLYLALTAAYIAVLKYMAEHPVKAAQEPPMHSSKAVAEAAQATP